MSRFFDLFVDFVSSILLLLHGVRFDMFGFEVDFLSIILSFFIIGFVISLFWKGAKV